MKKFFCIFFAALLLVSAFALPASAKTVEELPTPTVTTEYYDDGSYGVTEFVQDISAPNGLMATTSTAGGTKTFTYYNSNNVAIWAVRVTGTFTYTYGVSALAKTSTAEVQLYDSHATFVSKYATLSGATASATASIVYIRTSMSRTVSLTCDTYGALS